MSLVLQIYARDIKKILGTSSKTAKPCHTHSKVEIVFQITVNFTTRCDIWVSERRGCESGGDKGRTLWMDRSRDDYLA